METLISLNETLIAANKTASVSTRHTKSTSPLTVVDATYASSQCGSFTLFSWRTSLNGYSPNGAGFTASPFASGYFTPRVNGWYHICSFSRVKKGGNSNDVTILIADTVVAAYGSATTDDWRTTGVCFDAEMTTTQALNLRHRSTGSSDCIEKVSWPYNKLTIHNIGNNPP